MAKPERMISDPAAIDDILQRGSTCHLAMVDGDRPYVVPLCYGYRDGVLYAHSAREGRKIDLLQRNPNVCFDVTIDTELAPGQGPCRWNMHYRSVVGFGRVTLLDDPEDKRTALDIIMEHYGGQRDADGRFSYADRILENTIIIRVAVESLSGKENL